MKQVLQTDVESYILETNYLCVQQFRHSENVSVGLIRSFGVDKHCWHVDRHVTIVCIFTRPYAVF